MKQQPTVTRFLRRLEEALSKIDRLDSILKERNKTAFTVNFYHRKDRSLYRIKWSDQWNTDGIDKEMYYTSTYEITSRGIHFHSFDEHDETGEWWKSLRSWNVGGSESTMTLLQVPNQGPPNSNKSMYLFHQEKIREALSSLPAWAILCSELID